MNEIVNGRDLNDLRRTPPHRIVDRCYTRKNLHPVHQFSGINLAGGSAPSESITGDNQDHHHLDSIVPGINSTPNAGWKILGPMLLESILNNILVIIEAYSIIRGQAFCGIQYYGKLEKLCDIITIPRKSSLTQKTRFHQISSRPCCWARDKSTKYITSGERI